MRRWNWLILTLCAALLAGCNLAEITPTFTPLPPTATPIPQIVATFPADPNATAIPPNPNCASTPLGWIPYIVESGDSLSLLAIQTDSTIEELVAYNCLANADDIAVDQTIYVPHQPVIGQ